MRRPSNQSWGKFAVLALFWCLILLPDTVHYLIDPCCASELSLPFDREAEKETKKWEKEKEDKISLDQESLALRNNASRLWQFYSHAMHLSYPPELPTPPPEFV